MVGCGLRLVAFREVVRVVKRLGCDCEGCMCVEMGWWDNFSTICLTWVCCVEEFSPHVHVRGERRRFKGEGGFDWQLFLGSASHQRTIYNKVRTINSLLQQL